MCLADPSATRVAGDMDIVTELVALDGQTLLELGCGAGENARAIAAAGRGCRVIACEVDTVQHARNLAADAPPNVEFRACGAQAIDLADASVDGVFAFKSLHHVPVDAMPRALAEIGRVLRPGGFAYVSEPVFAGAFNEVIRVFHDEERVRRAAFDALCAAVDDGTLELVSQTFFLAPVTFPDFAAFEARIINATHTEHRLDADTRREVERRFAAHLGPDGARFEAPMRVDLLRRPAGG